MLEKLLNIILMRHYVRLIKICLNNVESGKMNEA